MTNRLVLVVLRAQRTDRENSWHIFRKKEGSSVAVLIGTAEFDLFFIRTWTIQFSLVGCGNDNTGKESFWEMRNGKTEPKKPKKNRLQSKWHITLKNLVKNLVKMSHKWFCSIPCRATEAQQNLPTKHKQTRRPVPLHLSPSFFYGNPYGGFLSSIQ